MCWAQGQIRGIPDPHALAPAGFSTERLNPPQLRRFHGRNKSLLLRDLKRITLSPPCLQTLSRRPPNHDCVVYHHLLRPLLSGPQSEHFLFSSHANTSEGRHCGCLYPHSPVSISFLQLTLDPSTRKPGGEPQGSYQ